MIPERPKHLCQQCMGTARETNRNKETGLSLVEIMISLAIASIIAVVMLTVLSTIYQDRQQTRILTSRIIDTAIMKQALNATVTTAGAIVTSTTSSTSNNNVLLNTFFGYPTWGNTANTANTGSTANLTPVQLPATPIFVTTSTVSFEWISNNGGGQELCQGTLQISSNVMRYIISTQNLASGPSTCTPNGQTTAEADFLIGNGWLFQPILQAGTGTSCLGPAFGSQAADALVAVKAPMAGTSATSSTASTQVSVCLPNW